MLENCRLKVMSFLLFSVSAGDEGNIEVPDQTSNEDFVCSLHEAKELPSQNVETLFQFDLNDIFDVLQDQ